MSKAKRNDKYYPFGLNRTDPRRNVGGIGVNLYQYNGKELVEDNGLGWNHYGARAYDAAVGRWWVVDPLADVFVNTSPYNYVTKNPLSQIDPTGMSTQTCETCPKDERWEDVRNSENNYVYNAHEDEAYIDDSDGAKAQTTEATKSQESGGENSSSGIPLPVIGLMAEYGQGYIYATDSKFHNTGWRDFNTGNRYGFNFYGNQHTSTPRLAKNTRMLLNVTGKGLGAIGYYGIYKEYQTNQKDNALSNAVVESFSNTISTFGGMQGAAWGIGWELGRLITSQPGYRKFVNRIDPDYRRGGNDGLLSTDDDW